jgi:hypothetical protein
LPDEGTGRKETAMTDPEREHLVRHIRDLERRLHRWRLACLALLGLLLVPVVLGGLLGVGWVPRLELQRARAVEAEMRAREALEQAEEARQAEQRAKAAEEALQQARQRVEGEAPRPAGRSRSEQKPPEK